MNSKYTIWNIFSNYENTHNISLNKGVTGGNYVVIDHGECDLQIDKYLATPTTALTNSTTRIENNYSIHNSNITIKKVISFYFINWYFKLSL